MKQSATLKLNNTAVGCGTTTLSAVLMCCLFLFMITSKSDDLLFADYFLFPFLIVVIGCLNVLLKGSLKINRYFSLSVVLFFISSLVGLIHPDVLETGYYFSYLLIFALVAICSITEYSLKSLRAIIVSLVFSCCLISVYSLIFKCEFSYHRYVLKFGNNTMLDPNFMAAFLVFGAFFTLLKIIHAKKLICKAVWLACFVLISLVVVRTGSRGGLLGLLIGSILTILIKIGILPRKKRKIYITVFIFVIVVGVVYVTTHFESANLSRYFDIKNYFDGSNSKRLTLWENAIKSFVQSPVFGLGMCSSKNVISDFGTGVFGDAHNTYLNILIHLGLIGAIPCFGLLLKLFKDICKYCKVLAGKYIGMAFILMIIPGSLTYAMWLNVILDIAIVRLRRKEISFADIFR